MITKHVFHKQQSVKTNSWAEWLHIDTPLLLGVIILVLAGLFILYSAGNLSFGIIMRQALHLLIASFIMFFLAQVPPATYRLWAPWIFAVALVALLAVLVIGHVFKGAKRWLSLGMINFQPSEIMKLALPLMLAWFFGDKNLPPRKRELLVAAIIIAVPLIITAKQPDLGTAILLAGAGGFVILLAGIQWRWLIGASITLLATMPLAWHFMHNYQKQRVLTFLNPERDPLGNGYHTIQAKIALGSGGIFGKGWLHGSQAHLSFLPEHSTDFIFAVTGEELGLLGCLLILALYLFIVGRGLYISSQAQDSFSRLLAGSISLLFFISVFINIGMVSGILPVVGLPLPLISYGGSSMITFMACFGILMSIQTHRKLLA